MDRSKPHLLILGGPTASGKSAAAVELARLIGGEIVSADSMQIYRGMDIGTATPTSEEQGGVPHHLLSFVNPATAYTAAMYREDAALVIRSLWERRIPTVVCGGSGLYIDALTRPMAMAEKSNESIRAALHAQADQPGGKHALHQRLKQIDPESASRLHENDVRRVIRALEIYELTGQTMTEKNREDKAREGEYDVSLYALRWPRDVLYNRINRRVDAMIQSGLVQEVRALAESGLPADSTAFQAIGYKEILAALRGECTMDEAVDLIKQSSRRYAKRQITWFTRDERTVWLEADEHTASRAIAEEIIRLEKEKGYIYEGLQG